MHHSVLVTLLCMPAPARSESHCLVEPDWVDLMQRDASMVHRATRGASVTASANNLSGEVLQISAPKGAYQKAEFSALARENTFSTLVVAGRNGKGLEQDKWVSNSETQLGHTRTKSLMLLQRMKSNTAFFVMFGLIVLALLIALIVRSILGTARAPIPEAQRPLVHTLADSSPRSAQVHTFGDSSSQRKAPAIHIPALRLPQVHLMTTGGDGGSTRSDGSTGSMGTLSTYRRSVTPPPSLPSLPEVGVHFMMTARSVGSAKSTRTPSPYRSFRNTFTDSSRISPRFTMASKAPRDTCEELEYARSDAAASQAGTSSNMYSTVSARGRAPTASMEGLKGVKGRVAWFSLGTPRPEDLTLFPATGIGH